MAREINRERYRASITVFSSLGEFLEAQHIPSGMIVVVHNGLPIDILFHRGPADSGNGLFLFHGAIEQKFTLPVFQGGGLTAGLNAHRIFIADPSLAITGDDEFDGGLTLGWHAGNYRQPDLQYVTTRIIHKFVDSLKITLPAFYGISGGGFASLYYGAQVPGSVIVPINPQTSIRKYVEWAVDRWANIGFGIDVSQGDVMSRLPGSVCHDIIPLYQQGRDCRILYMQNSDDGLHQTEHMVPFLSAKSATIPFFLIEDYWGPRHTQPPKELMTAVLQHIFDAGQDADGARLGFQAR